MVVSRRLTLEEFLQQPEEEPALEFADGVVTRKVAPSGPHSVLQSELVKYFDSVGLPAKIARAFPELRTSFAGQSPVPDVVVYRWERIARTPTGRVAKDFEEPPDIAVEIVLPGQSVNSLVRRCLWYVANGVRIALLVDPEDESIIDFRPDRPAQALRGADRIDFSDVLPGAQLVVQDLFAALQPD